MTLRHLMMMQRIDRGCARMNAGLAAVAIVLGLVTGAVATGRLVRASTPVLAGAMSWFLSAPMRAGMGEW